MNNKGGSPVAFVEYQVSVTFINKPTTSRAKLKCAQAYMLRTGYSVKVACLVE